MSADSQKELLALAQDVMIPTYNPLPFIAERGEGSYLWSREGKRFLDFSSGIGVNALGHSHPEVVAAVHRQAQAVCHTSNMFFHEPYVRICEFLGNIAFEGQAFLTNSGTEATEAALKLACRHFHRIGQKRIHFVSTHGSFHGRSIGSLGLTGQPSYHEGYAPVVNEARWVPFGDLDAMKKAITEDTIAVMLEPIQGNAGVRIPEPGYLAGVRRLCDEKDVLLILDEVQTGIARTGRWFAYQHENIEPDILVLAKALGGGLPLGAVVAPKPIAAAFTVGSHGTTFGGNPVACAAGLATLSIIDRDKLSERVQHEGRELHVQLNTLKKKYDDIVAVRSKGFMIGIETTHLAKDLRAACLDRGLLVTTAGKSTIRLLPPLNTPRELLDQGLAIVEKSIASLR